MEKFEKTDVVINIKVKATANIPYRDDYDITNNLHEIVEDNLFVASSSANLLIQSREIGDID